MRPLSELLGKAVLLVVIGWVTLILVAPGDWRPLAACEPLIWTAAGLGRFIAATSGAGGADRSETLDHLHRACVTAMERLFDLNGNPQ